MSNTQNYIFTPNDNEGTSLLPIVTQMIPQGNFGGALIIGYRGAAAIFSIATIDAVLGAGIKPENICIRLDGGMPEAKDVNASLAELAPVIDYAYAQGIRLFQFFNEPNWAGATGNARTPLVVYPARFMAFSLAFNVRWPKALIVTPGLVRAPGYPETDERSDIAWYDLFQTMQVFFNVLAAHCYFDTNTWNDRTWGWSYKVWHDWFPDKPILITEWACQNYGGNYDLRAQKSAQWLQGIINESYIIGAACFISLSKGSVWQPWEYDDKLLAAFAALASTRPIPIPPPESNPGGPSDNIEGGQTMAQTLAERYPDHYEAWVAAGGNPEEAFESYLLGQGVFIATPIKLDEMADNIYSHMKEIILAARRLPL